MKMGDRVVITERYRKTRSGKYGVTQKRIPFGKEGLFIGQRTIKEGWREFDSESGWYFVPKNHIRVALVVYSENENPVYVPLDAVTPKTM